MANIQDEQLTAYALGEVTEQEAKDIEQQLDLEAQQEVQELQELASLLSAEFQSENKESLSESRRQALFKKSKAKPPSKRAKKALAITPRPRKHLYFSAAAAVLLSIGAVSWFSNKKEPKKRLSIALATQGEADLAPAVKKGQFPRGHVRKYHPEEAVIKRIALKQPHPMSKTPALPGKFAQLEKQQAFLRISHNQQKQAPLTLSPMPMDPSDRVEPRPSDYQQQPENKFIAVSEDPLSTFSVDVDTASYANVRRFLKRSTQVPPSAIRIEEMVNYFHYDYAPPSDDKPFLAHLEVSQCPWNLKNRLVRVGIKGKVIEKEKRPPSNLVFLIDVSGSMGYGNKLPLLIRGMKMMVNQLGENDRVAIVVYASASGLVLPSTSCDKKAKILNSLSRLRAGGSTNGGAGIQLAYQTAVANFIEGGTNRVILATDGDFNVGLTNQGGLVQFAQEKAKSGVFLTVLGFGMNHRDSLLEQIANKGNGHYAVIDNFAEAKKVLVDELSGTLVTIAKDVKLQLEFNPNQVKSYRLIGYENRVLAHRDFNDDKKDAGEIGAGHTVTALYEIVPGKSAQNKNPGVDPLKYQEKNKLSKAASNDELLTLKIRYKKPSESVSQLLTFPVADSQKKYSEASNEFKFAASVAAFGMILRKSKHKGVASLALVKELASEGKGPDKNGYRAGFLTMIDQAMKIYK